MLCMITINSACLIFYMFLHLYRHQRTSTVLNGGGWERKGVGGVCSSSGVGRGGGAEGCSESTNTFLYSLWCIAQLPACCSFGQSSLVPPSCAHRWVKPDRWQVSSVRPSVCRSEFRQRWNQPTCWNSDTIDQLYFERMRQVLCLISFNLGL